MELHEEGSELLDFVITNCFLNGLCNPVWKKVVYEARVDLGEAIQVARVKYRKLLFKLYRVEVSLSQWEYRSSKASNESFLSEVAPETIVQVALTQCVELFIDDLFSKPSTKDECSQEVPFKQGNKVIVEDGNPQGEP